MKPNQEVIVYDGDLIGYTTATLINRYEVVEAGVLEKWAMVTSQGSILIRYVKNHSDKMKDGCAYMV